MYIRVFRCSILICLSLGLLGLFAACTSATKDSSEASSNNTTVASQNATPTISSIVTSTTHARASAQTGSISTNSTPVVTTPTPLQPTPHAPAIVKVAVPTPTPTSASTFTGRLTLVLACSGPKAQDGVSATNTHAKACVYTTAGASLTIIASFCNGKPDPNSALRGTFTANGNGFYEWDWIPQSSCQPISSWSVTVNAQLDGQTASVSQASSIG